MLPVPNLKAFQSAWLDLKDLGFALHGFFLFVGSDHYFPEYLNNGGLADLESWTADTCALFVLHSPSAEWVDYARKDRHVWWKLFGAGSIVSQGVVSANGAGKDIGRRVTPPSTAKQEKLPGRKRLPVEFDSIKNEPLLEIDGILYSPAELFSSSHDQFHHTMEIQKVLRRFNLPPTSHPCFVFFRDLSDAYGWFVSLNDLLNLPELSLRTALKDWFGGAEFRRLVAEAKRA
jgi:hypothetical protein